MGDRRDQPARRASFVVARARDVTASYLRGEADPAVVPPETAEEPLRAAMAAADFAGLVILAGGSAAMSSREDRKKTGAMPTRIFGGKVRKFTVVARNENETGAISGNILAEEDVTVLGLLAPPGGLAVQYDDPSPVMDEGGAITGVLEVERQTRGIVTGEGTKVGRVSSIASLFA